MKTLAGITLSVVALLASGCGSSGTDRLSDAAFTKQANAICTSANTDNAKITSSETGLTALKDEEKLISDTTKKLEALKEPTNRSGAFQSYISDLKHLDNVLVELEAAAAAHDATKIASIEKGVAGFESTGKNAAKAAGIDSCD